MKIILLIFEVFRQSTSRLAGWTLHCSEWTELLMTQNSQVGLTDRNIQGTLAGYDQKSNVVLSDSKERVYSMDEGVAEVTLGLYLVKGDMMQVLCYLEMIQWLIHLSTVLSSANLTPIWTPLSTYP
jgi:small nuclear ribonucleoprotein (snRNP)-like protein